MAAGNDTSRSGQPPRGGACPGCGREPGGERCVHCGIAVRVGPYRVRQVLGQRGGSRSYMAHSPEGPVVLKELSFSTPPKPAVLQAFHQEARQLQALTHPRIPRYLDMLQLGEGAEPRLYLVQEFIEGTSLETELARQHATELEARELARQVLDILRYLQGRSPPVFHGDVKPANLIRRPDGALFLVDFGAGWVPPSDPGAEASRYMPPEQLTGEVDATTDLFALGVLLAQALAWKSSAEQPQPESPRELLARADVSAGFRQFLERLTAVERSVRFTSAQEALRELELPEQAPPPPRRRVWPVALGVGASLASFGGGILIGRESKAVPPPTPIAVNCPPPTVPTREPVPPPEPVNTVPTGSELAAWDRPTIASRLLGTPGQVMDMTNSVEPAPRLKEALVPDHAPASCEFAWKKGKARASGHWDTGIPAAAFDHERATVWRSSESDGAWLEVELDGERVIHGVVVSWAWDRRFGTSAESLLQTSVDAERWEPLLSVTNTPAENDVPHRLWFPPRTARYVRFVGARWNGGWAHVRALEVYGPQCQLSWERADLSDSHPTPDSERPEL